MGRLAIAVVVLLAVAGLCAQDPDTVDDRTAILAILDVFEQAFEKRDAKLYASNFSEDAHWENASAAGSGAVKLSSNGLQVYTRCFSRRTKGLSTVTSSS